MPELPEVETIVRDLRKAILGRKIEDVWSDAEKIVRRPVSFKEFKKRVIGKKIKNVSRRAKNIIIDLSEDTIILIHQKMTGHLLLGQWYQKGFSWIPKEKGPMEDPINRFIHLIFWLDNGKMLVLSDLRKFAKVLLLPKKQFEELPELKKLGPEPLDKSFTEAVFSGAIFSKKGKIKQVLMNQEVISGIGNIYSDEILWEAKIHPLREISKLTLEDAKNIYLATKRVLKTAIRLKGDSMSDYRLLNGEKGGYQNVQKVYRREKKLCLRGDGGIITRLKIGGRSAHFCPVCQKL